MYLGPEDTARKLRSLAALRKEELQKAPSAIRADFLRARAWQWEDLAEPRELLAELAAEAGFSVDATKLPHDLLAAADLPPMPLADRLTLLSAQYGLTFSANISEKKLVLIAVPEKVLLERTYSVGQNVTSLRQQIEERFPGTVAEPQSDKLLVKGRLEELEQIGDALAGRSVKRRSVSEGEQRFTMKVKAPFDQVLKKLEEQKYTFQFDQAALTEANIRLDTPVTLDIKEASIDQLLDAACKSLSLSFRRSGKDVELFPTPAE